MTIAKHKAIEERLNNVNAVADEVQAGNIAYINHNGKIERMERNQLEAVLRLSKRPFASMTIADRALAALQEGLSVREESDLGLAIWRLSYEHPEKVQKIDLLNLPFPDDDRRGWFYLRRPKVNRNIVGAKA